MTSINYNEFQAGQGVSAPALNQNFTLTNNAIEALERSLNSSVTDLNSISNSKASKNGSTTEPFSVAAASNDSHAVNLWQLKIFVPVGSVIWYAGANVPTGYLLCDGSYKSKNDYPALFAIIGCSFGGDGNPYFNLPLLTDNRFIRGVAPGSAGSYQNSNFAAHTHGVSYTGAVNQNGQIGSLQDGFVTFATAIGLYSESGAAGSGTETYPKNVGLLPCIKY